MKETEPEQETAVVPGPGVRPVPVTTIVRDKPASLGVITRDKMPDFKQATIDLTKKPYTVKKKWVNNGTERFSENISLDTPVIQKLKFYWP